MAAFGKLTSLSGYQAQQSRESAHCAELALRISELPGAAFAAITLFYVVSEIAKLIW